MIHNPQTFLIIDEKTPIECMLKLSKEIANFTQMFFDANRDFIFGSVHRGEFESMLRIKDDDKFENWVDLVLHMLYLRDWEFDSSILSTGDFSVSPYGLVCIDRRIFLVLCVNLAHWFLSSGLSISTHPLFDQTLNVDLYIESRFTRI
jgi:hypothetical protein